VYVYSEWGRQRYVGTKFYGRFVEESHARMIKEKVLINPTVPTLHSIRKHNFAGSLISRTRLDDIRVLGEEQVTIRGETFMYNNVYAQVYLKSVEINGFELEGPQFAQTQRSIFETFWQMATPIKQFL
jgi:hypothetical protein